jgi:peptidoglycan/LPS O-acetylase OafA/YrhL
MRKRAAMNLDAITDARSPAFTPGLKRPPNVKALTSVRFFAALHVALYHLVRPFTKWGLFAGVIGCGYIGVSFFFVLSGFILAYSHAHEYEAGRGSAQKFWIARFARVYPVYLLSLIFAGYFGRYELLNKHALAYVADVFLLQSWSIRLINFFNPPGWTLSVETLFYFSFPFVLLWLRPSSRTRSWLSMTGFWLLSLALPLFCLWRTPAQAMSESAAIAPGNNFLFMVLTLPLLHLPEFLAGIAVGWFYLRFKPGNPSLATLAWLGLLLTAVTLAFVDRLPYVLLHNGLLIPIFAMLLLGLCGDNLLARLLAHPLLVLLGEASFALYLIHFMYNDQTGFWYGPDRSIREALFKLAVLLPLSVLLHLYVERPCRRWILDWWRRRHPDQVALAAAS